jgi:uncharacterized heparinase superfamily protein
MPALGAETEVGSGWKILPLYWHTLRRLPARQLRARLSFKLCRPGRDTRPAPPTRQVAARYVAPIEGSPALLAPDVFRFLNVERRSLGWEPADVDQLWRYNLHYFDDLTARDGTARLAWHAGLLERWVAENPPAAGTGWEPYPLSRRLVNWIKWDLRHGCLPAACRESLAVQARWLSGRIEHHLGGNHLIANAKALVHAGLYFSGLEAAGWHDRGMRLLAQQLPVQVLADGGHFERSTMYHAAVLEDLLDLLNLCGAYERPAPVAWRSTIALMLSWLRDMTHPDGEIAFFNDAAFKIAPAAAQLEAYAQRLRLERPAEAQFPLRALLPSGYVRAAVGPAYLLCDCAPVGPDEQPGHAHADTLSFELSLAGHRLCVNSGTSLYGTGPERQRQRGTAAHNTVELDGSNSSEVWAGFRVARRAHGRLLQALSSRQGLAIEGCHDGYRRLPGKNVHTRRWQLEARSLRIEDQITGHLRRAAANFHLHPDIDAQRVGPRELSLRGIPGWSVRMCFENAASVEVIPSTWHPEFGLTVANRRVAVCFAAETLKTDISWTQES